ncbi:MAG: zf-HC2 domain-containing protein [Myxococcales bacterium]|jgi:hypothetical protein
MNERKARALIDQHFVESLSPRKQRKLREHLSSCEGCRAYYDRLMAFEEAADGGKAEVERIGVELFDKLEASERKPLFAGGLAFTWPFPTVIAGAAAALALMVLVPRSAPEDRFLARGGPSAQVSEAPELLAVCFEERGKGPESPRDLTPSAPFPSCPRGGRVALAYRRARPGDRLVVLAIRDGEPSVLVPASGQGGQALEPGVGTNPLRGSFAIEPDAPAGEVSLVAVFGREVDAARLQAAAQAGEDLRRSAGDDSVVTRLGYRLENP